ncbi:MAG: GTP-binding protein [Gammaproteobacteria bacterium]
MKRIPVTLLTGFLGSGKTTLLAALLRHPAFTDTALIVNEFGEVSIDHLLVADLAENIIELRDGCLCCSIRGDLVMTLRDLWRKRCLDEIPRFARVVVETSGVADPVPLVHTLMANGPLLKVYSLDAVVCVVDALAAGHHFACEPVAASQAALADIIVISKTDLAPPAAVDALRSRLAASNGGAEILSAVHGALAPQQLLDRRRFQPGAGSADLNAWLGKGDSSGNAHAHDHGAEFVAHVIRHTGPLSLAGTAVFLNRIVNESGDAILRIKGLAGFREKGGRPAVLHAVRNKFYPVEWLDAWPDGDHESRLVFIGRHIDSRRIDELFAALCV